MNKKSRSSVEMNNKSFRSAMISGDVDPLIYVTCVVLLEKSSQMFTIYGQRADTDDGGLEAFLYKVIHVCIYKVMRKILLYGHSSGRSNRGTQLIKKTGAGTKSLRCFHIYSRKAVMRMIVLLGI